MNRVTPWDIRERTFLFSCDILKFTRKFGEATQCWRVANQLLDAGTSVGANAEEAKASYSRREFAAKNCIALKEARESVFWLRLILACDLSRDPEAERLLKEGGELVGILSQTVKSSRSLTVPKILGCLVLLLPFIFYLLTSLYFFL